MIVTKWGYPFGGGEEFMYQTMNWACKMGMKVYWICFTDSSNNNYDKFNIDIHHFENEQYGNIIKIPDGFTIKTLKHWLKLIKPDIVHHQGHMRKDFYESCAKLRIPFVSGFHFWTGAIKLIAIPI